MIATPLALVLSAVAVTGVLLAVVRRLLPDDPEPYQAAASAIFSMVGVLYAVVLAFLVIVAWENERKARADSQVEANAVARVYFTARSLPEPQRRELMTLARDYADTVAHQEWTLMSVGQTSGQARQQVAAMRLTTHQLRPASADQKILMDDTLEAVDELVDARRERTHALIPPLTPLMWAGLLASSAVTIGFTFLFNRPSFPLHLLMVGSMTALIVFVLWLIHDLSQPFSGAATVGPDAFDLILQRFQEFPPDSPS